VHGWYGEDVHHLSAKHSLAPVLHAYSCPDGAPKAYSIQRSLRKVLDTLETNGKVHGDLRFVNIMVNVSHTGKVILVDDGRVGRTSELSI